VDPLVTRYLFTLPDGHTREHLVRVDPDTVALLDAGPPAFWTEMSYHRCPACPLEEATHPHCPAALGLVRLVDLSRDLFSYDRLAVEVATAERTVRGDTTAQAAFSSLMGLVMATSGCPRTAFFKPMARFHLPLSTEEETIYRVASMYLLGQYFLHQEGQPADLALSGLTRGYDQVHRVNVAMARRLRAASHKDAALNALVLLDVMTHAVPTVIERSLARVRHLYRSYLG
jgi:hypothetical protein